ncbi:hypothetical protein [Flavobacterium sp.]|uniref:hypothetical protein n=1 Tax=Flavobacterium sp. TaxID=239 RepID=UPI003B9A538E
MKTIVSTVFDCLAIVVFGRTGGSIVLQRKYVQAAVALFVAIPLAGTCFWMAAVRLPVVATPKRQKLRTAGAVFSLQSLTRVSARGKIVVLAFSSTSFALRTAAASPKTGWERAWVFGI